MAARRVCFVYSLTKLVPPENWARRKITNSAGFTGATPISHTTWPASIMVGGNVKARVRGLRLVADDVDWTSGEGPEVHGPSDAMILMLSGRQVGADELTGDGAAELYDRL